MDPSVMNGIDLLMNQRKRANGSNGSSDAGSVASGSSRHSGSAPRAAFRGHSGSSSGSGSGSRSGSDGGGRRGVRSEALPSGFQRVSAPTASTPMPLPMPMPSASMLPMPPAAPPVISLGSFGSPGPGFGSGFGSGGGGGGGGRGGRPNAVVDDLDDDLDDEGCDDEECDDEDGDGGSDEGGSSIVQAAGRFSHLSPEEVLRKKRETLYELARIERKGVSLPRRFTMDDSLDEMRAELERIKLDRELDMSVRFQRKMLVTCVTGIELLNGKFDPFDVKLDGWSDSMHENMGDYDEVFEDLHMKYRSKAKMAPELKLMFMVAGSGVMFHLTNSMFRSSSINPPGFEQVMRQNPHLMRQYAQAAASQMPMPMPQQQQQQQQQSGGGLFGGLSGLFGGLFGGGGGSPPPGPAYPAATVHQVPTAGPAPAAMPGPATPAMPSMPAMRGPKPVNDVLRELHRNAFQPAPGTPSRGASPPPPPMNTRPFSDSNRIEIISNASDTDTNLTELADAVIPEPSAAPAKKKRAPGTRPRKAQLPAA